MKDKTKKSRHTYLHSKHPWFLQKIFRDRLAHIIHCSISHVDNRATLLGGILQGETLTVCFNDLSVFTEVEIPKPFVSK